MLNHRCQGVMGAHAQCGWAAVQVQVLHMACLGFGCLSACNWNGDTTTRTTFCDAVTLFFGVLQRCCFRGHQVLVKSSRDSNGASNVLQEFFISTGAKTQMKRRLWMCLCKSTTSVSGRAPITACSI
jgi:hypothetical protein